MHWNRFPSFLRAAACTAVAAAFLWQPSPARAAAGEPGRAADDKPVGGLREGDHVAIIGDSITEQKLYSVFIEDYLLLCKPAALLRTTQFGWSGETSWGFAGRMGNDMVPFGATVATTCFGMNDGGYAPQNPDKAKKYHDAQADIVRQLKAAGVRFVVVGSPGAVDTATFKRPNTTAAEYNKTLADERDIAKAVAAEQGVGFADVLGPMLDVMAKAKAKYGDAYPVAGGDGIHPAENGHLVMAYAFLKGLGCDGDIGTITVDFAGNKAEATDGHKILSAKDGAVEVESTRYPFCFAPGDPAKPNSTRGVLEFLPFNEDLNRFKLVVKGASGEKVKVTWGEASKEFPAADLAKGINLAAEFLDNPFAGAFKKADEAVRRQQAYETPLVKQWVHSQWDFGRRVPEEKETARRAVAALAQSDIPYREASAKAIAPVKHTIKVEAVK